MGARAYEAQPLRLGALWYRRQVHARRVQRSRRVQVVGEGTGGVGAQPCEGRHGGGRGGVERSTSSAAASFPCAPLPPTASATATLIIFPLLYILTHTLPYKS